MEFKFCLKLHAVSFFLSTSLPIDSSKWLRWTFFIGLPTIFRALLSSLYRTDPKLFINCSSLRSDGHPNLEETTTDLSKDAKYAVPSSDRQSKHRERRGSAGVVPSMRLLRSFQEMHAPYTQVCVSILFLFFPFFS